MWSAFVRQIAAYAITRRGKKLFALLGAMLLCFATTLLIDMQLFASASLTGALALFAAGAVGVQHVKLKRRERERRLRMAEDAVHRAARATARRERIGRSKAAFTGAIGGAAHAVADAVAGTARFFADAFAEMAQELADAYGETKATVGSAVNAGAQAVSSGAADLRQAGGDAFANGVSIFHRAGAAASASAAMPSRRLAGPHAIPRIALRPNLNL